MKLKSVSLFSLAIIMMGIAPARANLLFDIYGGATVGVGGETLFDHDDHKSNAAQSYGAVAGIDIPFVRAELEYDYLNGKDMDMHMGFVNVYAKMPLVLVQPYLGAGIGTIFDGKIDHMPHTDINADIAYQAMFGLTFDIPVLPFKIDAEARALYIHDVYKIENASPDMLHYDARVKLRYVF